ncbi:MAG: preprotein translocase subunit SecA, partial [Lutimonas sp.]
MSLVNSILKAFVGDKKKKDLKQLNPLVQEVRAFDNEMNNLSLDELRAKTTDFKQKIKDAVKDLETQIVNLKSEVETAHIDRKEEIYREIDELENQIYEITEEKLKEIQAEAFAVVKETAKRFANNTVLSVIATPYDREISGKKDYVTLNGEKAIWSNSWDAAGKPIVWDMVHYDVQLIGGAVLHQGKIAEMMT